MKILHIFNKLTIGGAETLIMNILRNKNNDNIKFDFLVHTCTPGEYEKEAISFGCSIYKHSLEKEGICVYIKNLKKIFCNYDIIHCHVRKYAILDLLVAKKMHIPTFLHCHSASSESSIYKNKLIQFLIKKHLDRISDFKLVCSSEAKKFLYFDNQHCILINNGVDHEKFKYSERKRNQIREKLSINEDQIVIGHVGSFRDVKNQRYIIELASRILLANKKYKFILIGEGEFKNNIIELCNEKNLSDYFVFTGNVNNVEDYLNAFDIFLFPSKYEGLPLSVVEAQLNGLYVLCSENMDKNVKICENLVWFSIDNYDNAINYILKFENRDRVVNSDLFNINDTVEFLISLYNSII